MMQAADLPETIAVFPLPGALLLPRSRLPLHIFEPRYLQMLEDALKTSQRLIGMVQPCPQPGRSNGLYTIGCAGRVTQFSETEDGRYLITLTGISRFRIQQEVEGFTPVSALHGVLGRLRPRSWAGSRPMSVSIAAVFWTCLAGSSPRAICRPIGQH